MNRPLVADDAAVLSFTNRLYERAEEGKGWHGALQDLVDKLQGTFAALHQFDACTHQSAAVEILRGPSFDEFVPILRQHSTKNVWMNNLSLGPLPRPGDVIASHRLYPEADFVNHSFYNDFLKGFGLFSSVGAVVDLCDNRMTTVTILRDRNPGMFREDEERYLKRVALHLRNAYRVERQLGASRASRALLCEVLEHLPSAVFALDPILRVVLANQTAEKLIASGDGVRVARGRLEIDDRVAARSLRQAVSDLDRARAGAGSAEGGAFPIGRRSCSRPYLATAMPMRPLVSRDETCSACCLLLVDDPEVRRQPPGIRLMQLWGLTAAEARVASLLAGGHSLREIADLLEIGFSTVRTHLQRIFMKTDPSRQGDLVRLLNRLGLIFGNRC